MSDELVCVGGPYHGQIMSVSNPEFSVAMMDPGYQAVYATNDINITDGFFRTRYRIEKICCEAGALRLDGMVFAWEEIKTQNQMVSMSMGLLLAQAMGLNK